MSLHFAEYGSQNPETIVFLHGGGGAGWMWAPQVEALQGDYHLIVPDLPESGATNGAGPFTIKSAAEQAAELISDRAHDGCAHVVGLSEGAQVLVQLLATRPETVRRAVVSSALVREVFGGRMQSEGVLRWTYRTTIAPFRDSRWWIRMNMRYSAGIPDAYYDRFAESFSSMSEDGFVHMLLENQRFRLPAGLQGVHVPALVVLGANEYKAMCESALDIAAALPLGEAYQVRHREKLSRAEEHNWSIAAPTLFTETVRAWLEQRDLPAELEAMVV